MDEPDPAVIYYGNDVQEESKGIWAAIGKVIPYFRRAKHVLLFKLDIMLLLWMFIAGVRDCSSECYLVTGR